MLQDLELLVEDLAALGERHVEGGVLVLAPAHGRLYDEPALADQVEGASSRASSSGCLSGAMIAPATSRSCW